MTDNGMIEAFRESNIIRHSQNLQSGIQRLLTRKMLFLPRLVLCLLHFLLLSLCFSGGVMRGSFPPHSCLQGGKLFSSPALRKHHLGVVVDAGVLELIWLEER